MTDGRGRHRRRAGMSRALAAFALLYRYKVDVLWVVLGGGAIGLLARLMAIG